VLCTLVAGLSAQLSTRFHRQNAAAVYLIKRRCLLNLDAAPTLQVMATRKKAAPPRPDLKLRGLSYSDWEDEAAQLRLQVSAPATQRRRAIKRAKEMLASVDDELEAMDLVAGTLDALNAVRVRCVRDLLIALRASLVETSRRLSESRSRQRVRKTPTPAI
jgi:hypothetical protein